MAILGLALSGTLVAGCDDFLDVDLSETITENQLDAASSARIQVNSTIALVECSYTAFVSGNAAGAEDVYLRVDADMDGFADYQFDPNGGECDSGDEDYDWFDPFQQARFMGEEVYARLTGWTDEEVEDREELMAVTALYTAVPYTVFGEHMCEVSVDLGPMMTPDDALAEAESWVDSALEHIAVTGDFEPDPVLLNDIEHSVEEMAYALRARIRWARGDLANAATDAAQVSQGFVAEVTRTAAVDRRRNKVAVQHSQFRYGNVAGPVDWWNPSDRTNPVTGSDWPDPIPFTGYRNLAVTAEGRAVDASGYPITTANMGVGGEVDSRVPVIAEDVPELDDPAGEFVQTKFASEGDPIPLLNWREMWLIRAEAAGGQTAIDRVNEIRAADGVIEISGTYQAELLADADQMENMILEERRRALFLEGRYWSTKIQNVDKLWFPRGDGFPPALYEPQDGLLGGVRMVMDQDEYRLNNNFSLTDRGTGCSADEAPEIL